MTDAFDKAKTAYQAFSAERIHTIKRQQKLSKQVETYKSDISKIELEIKERHAAYNQLVSAAVVGDVPDNDLDDAEIRIAGLNMKLERKNAMLKIAQEELRTDNMPAGHVVRGLLEDLGRAHCAAQIERHSKDFSKIKRQLVELFGGWGIQSARCTWPEFLKEIFPQPEVSVLEDAKVAFIDAVIKPIDKAAMEDAA